MSGLKEFGESAAREVLERIGRGVSKVQERKPLAYDLLESDDAYLVVFDAPGATRSDIQVRFVDSEVQVRIDRFRDFYENFDMRFPGRGLSLDGSAELPEDAAVDAESAGATLKSNGTLHVTIPKTGTGKDVTVADDDEESEAVEDTDVDVDASDHEEADHSEDAEHADEQGHDADDHDDHDTDDHDTDDHDDHDTDDHDDHDTDDHDDHDTDDHDDHDTDDHDDHDTDDHDANDEQRD
jgi:HSP20 family molecular chaperone IbpA